MTTSRDHILHSIKEGLQSYYKILNEPNANMEYLTADLDCSQVPLVELVKKADSPITTKPFWDQMQSKGIELFKKPCLYYFEIVSPDTRTILEAYRRFQKENSLRASAALKKNPPLETNILYVGKVKQNLDSRMYIHLGYYYIGATAGLQLAHWANQIDLKLKVHVYAFDPCLKEYVDPLELPLARRLKPLIGKH